MDDYNTSVLSEAKNEYSAQLVNILTPLIIEGFKSIFNEARILCKSNEQDDKYLMTFQNFLARVPKWNQEIIDGEAKRIVQLSRCNYLEDLLTCVHITQLKVLTSIRVASKQKKIDINIPKLSDFIHKVYIRCARKFYSNVYLYEVNVPPLTQQKYFRESETICKECILNVVRDSMPVEKILRAYMDETEEEEIVDEVTVQPVETDLSANIQKEAAREVKEEISKATKVTKTTDTVTSNDDSKKDKPAKVSIEQTIQELDTKLKKEPVQETVTANDPTTITVDTEKASTNSEKTPPVSPKPAKISFNDTDSMVSFNDKDKALGLSTPQEIVAPKTIERLEQISKIRSEQRKAEEEDEDEEKIRIHSEGPSLKLDALDVQVLDDSLDLKNPPILTGVESL